MKWGVLVFPGTWSDGDWHHVLKDVLHEDSELVWHRESDLSRFDAEDWIPAFAGMTLAHRSSLLPSFSFSRCLRSRLSNCSRIWKKNTPRISTPTSTSSAIPSSTTIGMP